LPTHTSPTFNHLSWISKIIITEKLNQIALGDQSSLSLRRMKVDTLEFNKIIRTISIILLAFLSIGVTATDVSNYNSNNNYRSFHRNYCTGKMKGSNLPLAFAIPDIPISATQVASGVVTYFGLVTYFDRPKGKLNVDPSFVEAKQSQVEGAGLGLYASKNMPSGTILGTYPGVLRPANKFMKKYESKPATSVYTWRFTDNECLIDPTDSEGQLLDYCLGGTDDFPLSNFWHQTVLGFWRVPTLLARINEPPIGGGGCNVQSDENLETREVTFSLSRDVFAGEELYMDYGITYDRSGYAPKE
jgi:hypothetical protein